MTYPTVRSFAFSTDVGHDLPVANDCFGAVLSAGVTIDR
jgi:hypothetical protein